MLIGDPCAILCFFFLPKTRIKLTSNRFEHSTAGQESIIVPTLKTCARDGCTAIIYCSCNNKDKLERKRSITVRACISARASVVYNLYREMFNIFSPRRRYNPCKIEFVSSCTRVKHSWEYEMYWFLRCVRVYYYVYRRKRTKRTFILYVSSNRCMSVYTVA